MCVMSHVMLHRSKTLGAKHASPSLRSTRSCSPTTPTDSWDSASSCRLRVLCEFISLVGLDDVAQFTGECFGNLSVTFPPTFSNWALFLGSRRLKATDELSVKYFTVGYCTWNRCNGPFLSAPFLSATHMEERVQNALQSRSGGQFYNFARKYING